MEDLKKKFEAFSSFIKTPTFDGKSSWSTHRRQFEAAAEDNGWRNEDKPTALILTLQKKAFEILQNIPVNEQKDCEAVVSALDIRYGSEHLQQVYQAQLKVRTQGPSKSLQEFWAEVEKLVRLPYSEAPDNFTHWISVHNFIDGVHDTELQQSMRMARHKTLNALEFEAAKNASRQQRKVLVRTINEKEDEETDQLMTSCPPAERKKLLKVGNAEILLDVLSQPYDIAKVVILEDSRICPNTEKSIQEEIAGLGGFSTALIEPSNGSKAGIIVARSPVNVTLKKGLVLGTCEPTVKISRIEEQVPLQRAQQPAKELIYSFKKTWSHRSEEELCNATRFVEKENDMFVKSKIIGRTDLVQHRINTSNANPIPQPPRRLPFAKQDEAVSIVEDMLKDGVIEESNSPWSSPAVVLVTKKESSERTVTFFPE
nr:uncharacterized protein LOC111503278 [Leptinotarsa decemlineata]